MGLHGLACCLLGGGGQHHRYGHLPYTLLHYIDKATVGRAWAEGVGGCDGGACALWPAPKALAWLYPEQGRSQEGCSGSWRAGKGPAGGLPFQHAYVTRASGCTNAGHAA